MAGTARNDHPTQGTLRRFVLGMTSPAENRVIVTHLLRQCGRCSQVLSKSLEASKAILRQSGKVDQAS